MINLFRKKKPTEDIKPIDFFLYFDRQSDGKKLIHILEKEGFKITHYEILNYNGKSQWSLKITKICNSNELYQIEKQLGAYAKKFHGEYDGYDRPV